MHSQVKMGELLVLSVRTPKEAMRILLALNLGRQAVWLIFALVMLLGAVAESLLYGQLVEFIAMQGPEFFVAMHRLELVEPLPTSRLVINGILLLLVAVVLTYLGAGGNANRFTDILLALSWYRGIVAMIAAVAFLVWFIAPPAALVLLVALTFYSMWLAINFVFVALSEAPLGRTFAYLIISVVLGVVAVNLLTRTILEPLGLVP